MYVPKMDRDEERISITRVGDSSALLQVDESMVDSTSDCLVDCTVECMVDSAADCVEDCTVDCMVDSWLWVVAVGEHGPSVFS